MAKGSGAFQNGVDRSLTPYELAHDDCLAWMDRREPSSIHAIVTDPPYGLKEYSEHEKAKLRVGRGGVWRIPPTLDGCRRSPLPRFTVLTESDKDGLREFFHRFAIGAIRVLAPGGHLIIASNPLLSQVVYLSLTQAGFEKRGEIIRLVSTLRGGDRPKNAHDEFPDVSVMPRAEELGTVGPVSQAVRGASAGQPPQMEDGWPAPYLGRSTVRRRHFIVPDATGRARDRSSSLAQAASFHEADRPRVVAAWRRNRPRPVHGGRIDNRRRDRQRLREHRGRDGSRLFFDRIEIDRRARGIALPSNRGKIHRLNPPDRAVYR